jgi:chromosome segregation ATPase
MYDNLPKGEEGTEKELREFNEEIRIEKTEIHELENVVEHEKEKLHQLEEKKEHLEHERHHHHPKACLVFIINGQPQKIEARPDWLLKTAVELALKESGNEGRPIEDWDVKWNNLILDLKKEIREYHFPECVDLFLSLKAGQGGNINRGSCR